MRTRSDDVVEVMCEWLLEVAIVIAVIIAVASS